MTRCVFIQALWPKVEQSRQMWDSMGDSSQVQFNSCLLSTHNVLDLCKCKICLFLPQWALPLCLECLVPCEPELVSCDHCLLFQEAVSLVRRLEPFRGQGDEKLLSLARLWVIIRGRPPWSTTDSSLFNILIHGWNEALVVDSWRVYLEVSVLELGRKSCLPPLGASRSSLVHPKPGSLSSSLTWALPGPPGQSRRGSLTPGTSAGPSWLGWFPVSFNDALAFFFLIEV